MAHIKISTGERMCLNKKIEGRGGINSNKSVKQDHRLLMCSSAPSSLCEILFSCNHEFCFFSFFFKILFAVLDLEAVTNFISPTQAELNYFRTITGQHIFMTGPKFNCPCKECHTFTWHSTPVSHMGPSPHFLFLPNLTHQMELNPICSDFLLLVEPARGFLLVSEATLATCHCL